MRESASFAPDTEEVPLRERIVADPTPALLWVAGALFLVLLELGRAAHGVLKLVGILRFLGEGIVATPAWVQGNVAESLGPAVGTTALVITAIILLILVAAPLKRFVPWSLIDAFGLELDITGTTAEDAIERLLLAVVLGVIVLVVLVTPVGGILRTILATAGGGVEWVSSLPTLTSRETIPNAGYRTPEGTWEGTAFGLSPAWAWTLRVVVVYAYTFVWLGWLWRGYNIYRTHYRHLHWTPRDDTVNRLRGHYWGLFGFVIVFMFVVMALWAPALATYSPDANLYTPYGNEFQYFDADSGQVESMTHGAANIQSRSQGGDTNVGPLSYDQFGRWAPMGTNQDGKDLFTQIVFGARISLFVGIVAVGLGGMIAVVLSLMTAYYKGLLDLLTILASDTIISIPVFLLVMMLSVIFRQARHPIVEVHDGALLLALIFAFGFWPGLWRAIRGPSLQVAEQEWVDAAKSYGQTPANTMSKHMAPYILGYIMIYASLIMGGIIIATAALSFLGLGISPPTPEWGRIISEGRPFLSTASWHISTLPGILIVLVVTAFNALGDGIRDAIDPESEIGGTTAQAAATGGGG